MELTPDRGILASPGTVYPVYIDPTFNWHNQTGGTPAFDQTKGGAPCNGVSEYNDTTANGDYGQLGAGYMGFAGGCEGDYHSYYQWKILQVIWGADINSKATVVNVKEVYSATCDGNSYTVDLHQSGTIGSGTDWNNRPNGGKPLSGGVHATASFGDACSSNPSESFDVHSAIATAASGHASTFTAYLSEDTYEQASPPNDVPFKRFADNPDLQIQYNLLPGVPAPSAMEAVTGSDKAACVTSKPGPYIGKTLASNTPVLDAKVSDADGDNLGVIFKYWDDGSSTTYTSPLVDNVGSGTPAHFGLPSTFTSALTSGQTVDWQVLSITDGQDTVGPSKTCYFTAEPNSPTQPSITANTSYPEGATGAAAGTAATFQFTNTGSTAASYFAYRLDVQPATSGTPASEKATATNNAGSAVITPLSPGPHTLYVAAVDAAGDPSPMQSYSFIAANHATTTCASLSACYNNVAISPDSAMTQGDADGANSYSATDLANAGWASGGHVIVDGARFVLPSYGGAGQNDNILAANQAITYSYAVPATGSSALMFLAATTNQTFAAPGGTDTLAAAPFVPQGTGVSGTYCFDSTNPSAYCPAEGVITYTDGTTQPYDLIVPDWIGGPTDLAAVSLPHENEPSGQISTNHPKIYPFAVPLQAGKTVASVTLPDVGTAVGSADGQALHIFSMASRNTTAGTIENNGTVAAPPTGQTWTGAWDNPNEGNYNFQGSNFSNQTFRIALKPSISGGTIRIKLDNALGTSKLNIGEATVALDAGSPSAVPSGTVQQLFFGGSGSVTIPEGGMVFSDPLTFAVTANQYLLVSFDITNSVPYLVQHSWANTAYTYLSAAGSGNKTTDTTGTPFSGTGTYQGWFADLLTSVDVATVGVPTLAVLGDGLIDAWQPNTSPNGSSGRRLSDQLAAAEPTAPTPYGTIAEGIESNQIMVNDPQTYNGGAVGGPSVLSRIDRDILDQPGITTVVLYQGLEDVLHGQTADNLDTNGYTTLLNYFQEQGINVIAPGLTPCDGYAGDGASANDPCTTTVDGYRTTANDWLSSGPDGMNPWSVPSLFYVDPDATLGVTDADGLTGLNSAAAISDKVNLTNPGYAALASAILGPQNTWLLNDGPGATTALDIAANTTSPFILNSAGPAADATLSSTGATWSSDATRGEVLTLDGTAGDAVTSGPVLNTSKSYSVSAWVYLTDSTEINDVISQDGTYASGFRLQYRSGTGIWQLVIPNSDANSPSQSYAEGTAPTLNAWTHLVGVYNAVTGTASIYENGALAGSVSVPSTFNAAGPLAIGRGMYGGVQEYYWHGNLSDVQAWNYALTPDQVTALYKQIS